jgi:hypothetical protein
MTLIATRRKASTSTLAVALVGFLAASAPPEASTAAGPRSIDPATVLPLDKIPEKHRDSVVEIIRDHTMHRKAPADTFPCHSKVYLTLVNEPLITLALWQDLATSPVKLHQIDANRFQGTDGAGATATWEYLYRSPKLHVLLSDLDYVSPRGTARLNGRILLVVRTGFYREVNGEPWISHEIEAFVKVDSKGWKALAKTVRPLLEKVLEDQVQEAGWFVSLMGRLVETHPNWACSVVLKQDQIPSTTRESFRNLVAQVRKPNASTGRPQVIADNAPANDPGTKRR